MAKKKPDLPDGGSLPANQAACIIFSDSNEPMS
jgi:hypothetical protein